MLVIIDEVVPAEELVAARRFIARANFEDGRLSAGQMASAVKNNLELPASGDSFKALNQIVFQRLHRHPHFQAATMPNKISTPIYSAYTEGMEYGEHVDNPLMGDGPFLRTDVAVTLFLSEPETYQGGELSIRTEYGEQQVKLAAGSAVIYPAGSLHRVAKVQSGERLAMVLWVQSLVQRADQRALLYDLWKSRESLLVADPEHENTQRIDHCYANLVRMWSGD